MDSGEHEDEEDELFDYKGEKFINVPLPEYTPEIENIEAAKIKNKERELKEESRKKELDELRIEQKDEINYKEKRLKENHGIGWLFKFKELETTKEKLRDFLFETARKEVKNKIKSYLIIETTIEEIKYI